jgi:hypothetical protein
LFLETPASWIADPPCAGAFRGLARDLARDLARGLADERGDRG